MISKETITLAKRGLAMKCPACGEGKLLQRYLKPHAACPECGEDFAHLNAEDGPAWLTILIVGHLSIPLLLSLLQSGHLDNNWVLPVVITGTVILTFALLPLAKGLFMAGLWKIKQPGA